MTPQPGRPRPLAATDPDLEPVDLLDAWIVGQAAWYARQRISQVPSARSVAVDVLRESMRRQWEIPRVRAVAGRGGVAGSRGAAPLAYPWSPRAHALLAAAPSARTVKGIELDHLVGLAHAIGVLLDPATDLDPSNLVQLLPNLLAAAVVTALEHESVRGRTGTLKEPWAGYRAAGIPVDDFVVPAATTPAAQRAASAGAHGFAPVDLPAGRRSTGARPTLSGRARPLTTSRLVASESDLEAFRAWLVTTDGLGEGTARSYKSWVGMALPRLAGGGSLDGENRNTRSALRAWDRYQARHR